MSINTSNIEEQLLFIRPAGAECAGLIVLGRGGLNRTGVGGTKWDDLPSVFTPRTNTSRGHLRTLVVADSRSYLSRVDRISPIYRDILGVI